MIKTTHVNKGHQEMAFEDYLASENIVVIALK